MNGSMCCRMASLMIGLTCLVASPRLAKAQSAAASAEALFAEGRRLMSEGQVGAACTKFAASNKLDPSSGTLLNLASCYEKVGRIASAWAAFQEAASLAQSANRVEHVRIAQKRAATLEPLLPRVTVRVAQAVEGLEIRRDDVLVTQAEYGLPVPVDPGPHTYVAKAPHHQTWTGQLNIDPPVDASVESPAPINVTMEIPLLTRLPETAEAPPPPSQKDASTAPPEFWTGRRIGAVVSAGIGVIGIGIGTAFGLAANSTYNDSLANCPRDKNLCTSAGVSQRDDARTQGNIATVGFVIGGLGLATAGVLLLLPTASDARRAGVELRPTLGGMTLRGRW
jgi:hypothetical protein